ncbi:hypothetical protein KA183_20125 [bacterium]|nr:hypothetical protein [bacterium]
MTQVNLRKFISVIQLLLIVTTVVGLDISERESSFEASSDISHFSGHDPFHSHSDPCQNKNHEQHVCHFGHCACVFFRFSDVDLGSVTTTTKVNGFLNANSVSSGHGKSLFRPPIDLV